MLLCYLQKGSSNITKPINSTAEQFVDNREKPQDGASVQPHESEVQPPDSEVQSHESEVQPDPNITGSVQPHDVVAHESHDGNMDVY